VSDASLHLLHSAMRIRMVEQAIADRYAEQEMRCPTHLSIGQESVPVAVSAALRPEDQAVSAHRSHAHYLARGGSLPRMIAELHGRATGCAGGRGGSMHLIDPENGFVAAVPIVGSSISIGTGLALGAKLQKTRTVTVVYLGDAATEEGVFSECLNFAALHDLRVLFVCENNYYSVYTHIATRQAPRRDLSALSQAHGVDAIRLPSQDIPALADQVAVIISTVRRESRPALLDIETFRTLEHCGPNSDDHLEYRDPVLIAKWTEDDPVSQLRERLLRGGQLSGALEREWQDAIMSEIDDAFSFARRSPFPTAAELLDFTHAS